VSRLYWKSVSVPVGMFLFAFDGGSVWLWLDPRDWQLSKHSWPRDWKKRGLPGALVQITWVGPVEVRRKAQPWP
jgi:hypothetical protein